MMPMTEICISIMVDIFTGLFTSIWRHAKPSAISIFLFETWHSGSRRSRSPICLAVAVGPLLLLVPFLQLIGQSADLTICLIRLIASTLALCRALIAC
jgi:hypothetical protein